MVRFVTNEMHEDVVRDRHGSLGIRQSNLPKNAAYAYELSDIASVEKVRAEDFEDGADADLFGRQSAEDRRMTVVPLGVNFWAHLALRRWCRCEEAICVSCEKSNECWKGSRENYLGGARPHCGRCWHALYMGRLGSPP